jgi:excinuclease ABC subunit B
MRTTYDIEMMRQVGSCSGIENYSMHIDGRTRGSAPNCLLDYFPEDFLLVVDESHVAVPQIGGMYEGDMSRKRNLVEHGFRLPSRRWTTGRCGGRSSWSGSARPSTSVATPGNYELDPRRCRECVEQIIRPTGLIDPEVIVKPTKGQIDDLIHEIRSPRGQERAGAGHDADQEDGRGPHRLPARARHPGALPALRGRHPAPGRVAA